MTELEKLTMLQNICGDSDATPEILKVYLDLAEGVVVRRAYPYLTSYILATVPKRYETLQVQIANELYLHRGAEGEQGHSENGIVRSYENGFVSDSLLRQITPFGRTLNEKIPENIEITFVAPAVLAVGESEKVLALTVVECTDKTVLEIYEGYTFESSDTNVVSIENDVMTAKAQGTATITITGKKSEVSTTFEVVIV